MSTKIAVSVTVAARNLIDSGIKPREAVDLINGTTQPAAGYIYAEDLARIKQNAITKTLARRAIK